jgi:hypothetical protein
MAGFTKEDADKALEGLNMTVTARRGGNLQVSFAELGGFKHVIDPSTGEETMSRDEAIARHQLSAVDALRKAGMPARISNIRKQTIGDQEVFTFSPSVWVNNVQNANVGATRALTAKLEQTQSQVAMLMALLPDDVKAKLAAATQAQSPAAASEEIPL